MWWSWVPWWGLFIHVQGYGWIPCSKKEKRECSTDFFVPKLFLTNILGGDWHFGNGIRGNTKMLESCGPQGICRALHLILLNFRPAKLGYSFVVNLGRFGDSIHARWADLRTNPNQPSNRWCCVFHNTKFHYSKIQFCQRSYRIWKNKNCVGKGFPNAFQCIGN